MKRFATLNFYGSIMPQLQIDFPTVGVPASKEYLLKVDKQLKVSQKIIRAYLQYGSNQTDFCTRADLSVSC